jgi:MFS family permease
MGSAAQLCDSSPRTFISFEQSDTFQLPLLECEFLLLIIRLQSIVKDVHSTNIQGFWAVTAYQVCSTVLQPTSASASGIFGRKTIVLLGIILFTIGALLASLAQDVTLLIVGRCIQGSGGGTLMTMTFVVLTDLVSLKERGKWVGLLSMVWLVGAVLGPIIGGVFSEKVSWVCCDFRNCLYVSN